MPFIGAINEGGQTIAHKVRMFQQVLKIALFSGALVGILHFSFTLSQFPRDFYAGSLHALKALLCEKAGFREVSIPGYALDNADQKSTWKRNRQFTLSSSEASAILHVYLDAWIGIGEEFLKKSIQAAIVSSGLTLVFFYFYGKVRRKKEHISGRKHVSNLTLKMKIKSKRIGSNISIGSIPMIKGSETQHMLITGGTGSGKTNCLKDLIRQISQLEQKAVVIDPTGDLTEAFYSRERGDLILNPFDERSQQWNPWNECTDKVSISAFCEALIPPSTHQEEEYWREGARAILGSTLEKTKISKKTSDLVRFIMKEPLADLSTLLEGTDAASFVDMSSEKTAGSMRSVCTRFVKPFTHLEDTEDEFTIRDWMKNDSSGWLFLACQPHERAAVKGLLRAWFSLSVRALQQMNVDLERRRWFIIDELPSLEKLDTLQTLVCEGRKYGGAAALSFQSPSQLEEIYGRSAQKTIIANCATRVVFSEKNFQTANEISRCLGESEYHEHTEGISYGSHEMRDGVSISKNKKRSPTICADKIISLKPNEAFLMLPGELPITKIKISIMKMKHETQKTSDNKGDKT